MKLIPEAFLFILSIAQGVSVLPGMQEGSGKPTGAGGKGEDDIMLDSEWTIWHERVKVEQGGLTETDYMKELINMGAFQTLKEFWELWGTISFESAGTTGIKPIWEDPANQDGGKWVVTVNQEHEDHQRVMKMWFSLVVAVFCRQLEYSSDMCGLVLAVRNWGTGLHVWNMHAGDLEKQEVVKQSLHKLLKTKKIKYIRHQTSILKNLHTSDSEGSKPKNWGDKKRVFNYDSEHKSRPPPSAQDVANRGRRFSVGSEAKPDLSDLTPAGTAPPRPSLAPPAKNPWNAPKFGAPEPIAEVPESSSPPPTPTPAPAVQPTVPPKNPWNAPPKTAPPTFLASSTESTPAPTPSSPTSTATSTPAPVATPVPSLSSSQEYSSSGENKSFAPTNPWKKPPKQNVPDFSVPKKEDKKETKELDSKDKEPKQPKQPKESKQSKAKDSKDKPEQTEPTKKQKNDDFQFVKPAPVVKEKPASAWDGKKVIKTLETADKTDFMPIEPVKPEKTSTVNKALKAKKRNYTTDPSSGEEDNAKRVVPNSRPQPLPQNVTAAPVFSTPAPSHPVPPSTSSTSATTPAANSEWSVIADKPKRKPRQGSQDNTNTNTNTQSDREAYTRPRPQQPQPQPQQQQHEYEVLEGIQEEEDERAARELEERTQARSETQTSTTTEKTDVAMKESSEEQEEEEQPPFVPPPSTPTIASLIAANANAEAFPSPSKGTPNRRKRELGVRHKPGKEEKYKHDKSQSKAEAAASQENLKVLILAPCAMVAILLLIYFLFF